MINYRYRYSKYSLQNYWYRSAFLRKVLQLLGFKNPFVSSTAMPNYQLPNSSISSVVDPKLFFSDPDPIFRRVLDPDPDPT
jgi:hypothetical protein